MNRPMLPALALLIAAATAQAVTFCHDYTYYRVTGKDSNDLGVEALKMFLEKNGYKPFPFTAAAERPDAMKSLKPGDVIIFGTAHSGFVGAKGIDHFLQVKGMGNMPWPVDELPLFKEGRLGGLHIGDTIAQVKTRGFIPFKGTIVVYRKVK